MPMTPFLRTSVVCGSVDLIFFTLGYLLAALSPTTTAKQQICWSKKYKKEKKASPYKHDVIISKIHFSVYLDNICLLYTLEK